MQYLCVNVTKEDCSRSATLYHGWKIMNFEHGKETERKEWLEEKKKKADKVVGLIANGILHPGLLEK